MQPRSRRKPDKRPWERGWHACLQIENHETLFFHGQNGLAPVGLSQLCSATFKERLARQAYSGLHDSKSF